MTRKVLTRQRLVVLGLLPFVGLVVLVATLLPSAIDAQQQVIIQHRFNEWGYKLLPDPDQRGAYIAIVDYGGGRGFRRVSAAEAARFQAEFQQQVAALTARGYREIDVQVSLKSFISLEELRQLYQRVGVGRWNFKQSAVANDGHRLTIHGRLDDEDFPQKIQPILDRIGGLKSSGDPATVGGVLWFEGSIAASAYASVLQHPAVLVVDPTRSLVLDHAARAVPGIDITRIDVRAGGLAPDPALEPLATPVANPVPRSPYGGG